MKYDIETITYGKCYLPDAVCVYETTDGHCTNENCANCRWRTENNDINRKNKCYYPAECNDCSPKGYCTISKDIKCSYRGNNPLDTQEN